MNLSFLLANQLGLSALELQQYLTLALTALGLSGFIFGATPKGWPMLKTLFGFLGHGVFYRNIYDRMDNIEDRVEKLEANKIPRGDTAE